MLSKQILIALRDCRSFRSGGYVWKRRSMEKAVALGLAREVPSKYAGVCAFELTAEGIAAASSSGLPPDFSEGEGNSISR